MHLSVQSAPWVSPMKNSTGTAPLSPVLGCHPQPSVHSRRWNSYRAQTIQVCLLKTLHETKSNVIEEMQEFLHPLMYFCIRSLLLRTALFNCESIQVVNHQFRLWIHSGWIKIDVLLDYYSFNASQQICLSLLRNSTHTFSLKSPPSTHSLYQYQSTSH